MSRLVVCEFDMSLSFRVKKKPVLPMEIHLHVDAIFGRNPKDLQAEDFKGLFAKLAAWFTLHFEQVEQAINALPTTIKKIRKLELMREIVETSTCFKGTFEIFDFVENTMSFLDPHNTTHFPIIVELLSLMSSFLEKFEDNNNAAFQRLHQAILLKAHRLSSTLCLCMTVNADKLYKIAPDEAKTLYQTASTYGELCVDYHNLLTEFPTYNVNNAAVKITTQTLSFLAKCYLHKGEYSLAIETLFEMQAHYNKFNIKELIYIALILNACQNLNKVLIDKMDSEEQSTDTLPILQKSLRLSKRHLKYLEDNAEKLHTEMMSIPGFNAVISSSLIDCIIAMQNYFIIVKVDILKDALIEDNAVIVTLPPSMPHKLIEREIRRLKILENQLPVYAWHADNFCFVIKNALDIDLDSLRSFKARTSEIITKFNSSEAQRLLRQSEIQRQLPLPEANPVSAAVSTVVAAAIPMTITAAVAAVNLPDPEVESLMVDLADELSIHEELPVSGSLLVSPSLLSKPLPTLKHGKDFGFTEPPFADAVCNNLCRGLYVSYSPGKFIRDQGCDDIMQARFEALAADPVKARKCNSNGFKMWPAGIVAGQHTITIEGKLTKSALRLLPSKKCTNHKGETAYYFDTIQNTKRGKKANITQPILEEEPMKNTKNKKKNKRKAKK